MSRVRALLPRTVLQRVRLAALLFACSAPISQFPIGMDPHVPEAAQVRAFAALVLLLGLYVLTFVRRRPGLLCPVVVGVLIFTAGYALVDPMAVIALCMGTMVHQSLYGGRREAIIRAFTVSAAYLLTIALSAAAAQRGLDRLVGAPQLAVHGEPRRVGEQAAEIESHQLFLHVVIRSASAAFTAGEACSAPSTTIDSMAARASSGVTSGGAISSSPGCGRQITCWKSWNEPISRRRSSMSSIVRMPFS